MKKSSIFASAAALATAGALTVSSLAGAVADPLTLTTPKEVTPLQQYTATAGVPLAGDFDGNGLTDVFWYVAGSGADTLWLSNVRDDTSPTTLANRFTAASMTINGTYKPFVGDFDGNGVDDVFWYAPGSAPDAVWYFDTSHHVTSTSVSISGTYTPVVANLDEGLDGEGHNATDDILWYSSTGTSTVWKGTTSKTFTPGSLGMTPPLGAKVFTGNFALNLATESPFQELTDLLFYVPGTGADAIWRQNPTGPGTKVDVTINGKYNPIVGDFAHPDSGFQVMTDIFWYAPGTVQDYVWLNTGSGFSSTPTTVNGKDYRPLVIPGQAEASRIPFADAIFWNNPKGADSLWTSRNGNTFQVNNTALASFTHTDPGTRTPITGEFSSTSPFEFGDVFWYSLGANSATTTELEWLEVSQVS